jgi:iron complex transport system substrate-binding protein
MYVIISCGVVTTPKIAQFLLGDLAIKVHTFAAELEDYQKNPPSYESLAEVQGGQIYTQLPYNNYNTNLDTAIADAYYLGKILYPTAFAGTNPEQKTDGIYQALLGRPVYDQMAADFGGFGKLTLVEP